MAGALSSRTLRHEGRLRRDRLRPHAALDGAHRRLAAADGRGDGRPRLPRGVERRRAPRLRARPAGEPARLPGGDERPWAWATTSATWVSSSTSTSRPRSSTTTSRWAGPAGPSRRPTASMLSGGDDRAINDWFIEEAFPPEHQVTEILSALGGERGRPEHAPTGTVGEPEARPDRQGSEDPGHGGSRAAGPRRWQMGRRRRSGYDPARRSALAAKLTGLRKTEQAQMDAYAAHTGCLMEFLSRALDDPHAGPCGACAPCKGQPEAMRAVEPERVAEAVRFLRGGEIVIEPRKQWGAGSVPVVGLARQHRPGGCARKRAGPWACWAMAAGAGPWPRRGSAGAFNAELADALAELVRRWNPTPVSEVGGVRAVAGMSHDGGRPGPCRRPSAGACRSGACWAKKRATRPQAEMENSFQQARNLDAAFEAAAVRRAGAAPRRRVRFGLDAGGWRRPSCGKRERGRSSRFVLACAR